MLGDGSDGRIDFSDTGETSIVEGKAVIGRSVGSYLRLLRRIDAIELYYMVLEEVFARTKGLVGKDAYEDALAIIHKEGIKELKRMGVATDLWEKEIQKLHLQSGDMTN